MLRKHGTGCIDRSDYAKQEVDYALSRSHISHEISRTMVTECCAKTGSTCSNNSNEMAVKTFG